VIDKITIKIGLEDVELGGQLLYKLKTICAVSFRKYTSQNLRVLSNYIFNSITGIGKELKLPARTADKSKGALCTVASTQLTGDSFIVRNAKKQILPDQDSGGVPQPAALRDFL
jgi:hypothetical protein